MINFFSFCYLIESMRLRIKKFGGGWIFMIFILSLVKKDSNL
ncbi:hypothetical protein BVAVS116_0529 [Borreliella valaisiana VS116]|uniref:Uncharacterized protein n=1 Tax=Borreliella valaisiana VS116 TaxID=445987 RepID=D6RY08_BORVA|nr:hypothetical protein BVAVS116_0529 [Borreliella valaisiana VS116]